MSDLDIMRQTNYQSHHEFNSVRNEMFPSHHSSQLSHHRQHPYAIPTEQQSQPHRFPSQQSNIVQYHHHHHHQQSSVVSDVTSVSFDAERCARELVASPLSSTDSSTTATNTMNSEEHHSTGLPPMTPTSANSQP